MKNTIFSARGCNTGIFIAGAANLDIHHCLFYMPNCNNDVLEYGDTVYNSTQIVSFGTGNLYGDPMYLKPAVGTEGDYRVQTGSPAIDNGTGASAPQTDLAGVPRPQGQGYDIGAYEYLPEIEDFSEAMESWMSSVLLCFLFCVTLTRKLRRFFTPGKG